MKPQTTDDIETTGSASQNTRIYTVKEKQKLELGLTVFPRIRGTVVSNV
jgi:hypothetical protein